MAHYNTDLHTPPSPSTSSPLQTRHPPSCSAVRKGGREGSAGGGDAVVRSSSPYDKPDGRVPPPGAYGVREPLVGGAWPASGGSTQAGPRQADTHLTPP
ncbi:hypothetical protein E2C01_083068 [Portunus trituberculatus]|uniref:Uncharacterized protein n=1 Tax=Portunus trituberculatus TaxID=210409 RepID=A0A5B7J0Y0_PORTR|nr:hypothetical protein [Portunus trituberculatus]